jgi:hypothetical protein
MPPIVGLLTCARKPTRAGHCGILPAFYLRIYLVNDNLSLHWTPEIRAWAELHNVELVPTPTPASHLNRIDCQFRPLWEFVLMPATTPATPRRPLPFIAISTDATLTSRPAEFGCSNPGQELPDTPLETV